MSDSGPLTQAQALALLKRTSDEGWLTAELSGPDGTAVINARTAVAAATSVALQQQAACCTISDAPGGSVGVCTLTVERYSSPYSIVLPQGYPFQTAEGIDLILSAQTTIPGTSPPSGYQSFALTLHTLRQTELVNTFVPAFDSLQKPGTLMIVGPAGITIYDSGSHLVLGPGASTAPDQDYCLLYYLSTPITGATSDWLSAHGDERGQRRQSGETTEEYRARIRLFPDAVSPVALATAIHAAAENAGLPDIRFVEPFDSGASATAIATYGLTVQDTPFLDVDYLDDPIGIDLPEKAPWRTLEMVSAREGRAYFRLQMDGVLREPDGAVPYLDDGYLDDPNWGYPEDGLALREKNALMTVANTADQLRAGGVQFDFYVEDAVVLPSAGAASGASASAMSTVVWTLLSDPTAVPGSETVGWILRDCLLSHTPADPGVFVHQVQFTFSDATTFATPLFGGLDSEHLSLTKLVAIGYPFKPIVKIEGAVDSNGATSVTLVGTFWAVLAAL